jgi:ectoine hydroxylase-related dioxygenase (phytanoyl-CoA dioxygenase family)
VSSPRRAELPAPHPWNRDFEWRLPSAPPRRLSPEQLARFDEAGACVLQDVFTPDELAPVIAELDAAVARAESFLGTRPDGRLAIAETGAITFAPNLVAGSALLADFARHPGLLAIARDLLGPDVDLYWDQAVYKHSEKPRPFPWHQDNGYTFVDPQQYLTCWIALSDATPQNGCPRIAPGLHRRGTLAHRWVDPLGFQVFEEPPSCLVTPVRAGGIVVFSSLTPHATGPNLGDAVRKTYILQYTPAGAAMWLGDPRGEPVKQPVCSAPHQFPVLRGGRNA